MRRAMLPVVWLLPVLVGCKVATVRPIESRDEGPAAQSFDATSYVESLWAEDVPAALEQAVDLRDLLPALAADPGAARARWGRREGSGPYDVIVKGSGRVLGVDTSSRTGMATVEVGVPGGTDRVRLQIGPVLQGTSIRDGLPTVSFDQFVNQIQYAEVAGALNARVEKELAALDPTSLVGRRVRFAGMAILGDERPLTVTPVRLETEEAP